MWYGFPRNYTATHRHTRNPVQLFEGRVDAPIARETYVSMLVPGWNLKQVCCSLNRAPACQS